MTERAPKGPHKRLVGLLRHPKETDADIKRRNVRWVLDDGFLATAADELDRLRAENEALRRENQSLRAAQVAVARLRKTLDEAGPNAALCGPSRGNEHEP